MDSSDLLPTFAELAGTKLPSGIKFDGQSFASPMLGVPGKPREWIFNQLADMWYVREVNWKLNQSGELFDMSDAPFSEKKVTATSTEPASAAARQRLSAVLTELNPAGGIRDSGDGSGRHAGKAKKKSKQAESKNGLPQAKPSEGKPDRGDPDTEP